MEQMRPSRGSHAPDSYWDYNSWDFNALGTILTVLTGKDVWGAFLERIAAPLQMQDFGSGDYRCRYVRGSFLSAYHADMSARDLARFGLLALHNGRWGDRRIIPAEWIRESTTAHSLVEEAGLMDARAPTEKGYGYMWWTGAGAGLLPTLDLSISAHAAFGVGGQAIMFFPDKDFVIVRLVDGRDPANAVTHAQLGPIVDPILAAAPDCQDRGR